MQLQISDSQLKQALQYLYSNTKLTRQKTYSFSINYLLDVSSQLPLRLRSKILLFTVILYQRNMIFILEDLNNILFTYKKREIKHQRKHTLPLNNLLLESQPDFDVSIYENNLNSDNFIPMGDFDCASIEIPRIESNISNDFQEINVAPIKKKRKIDQIIERSVFMDSLRKTLVKESQKTIENSYGYNICLPDEIQGFFNRMLPRHSIEVGRDAIEMDSYAPIFSDNVMNDDFHNSDPFLSSFDDEGEFEAYEQNNFIFNEIVKNSSRYVKSKKFYNLLVSCAKDKLTCSQENSYGLLKCSVKSY